MRWTSALAIYTLFWAFSVFLVLPWNVRTHEEAGVERVPGQADSAPHEFRAGHIAKQVTVVATLLFALYYANYVFGWITPDMLDVFDPKNAA